MRPRVVSLLLLLCWVVLPLCAQDKPVSFNLSTSKTFAPGETPSIHLYTHNVDAMEFRIYRVNDPVKFLENLRELHSFGPQGGLLGPEQIDGKSWLERFHDWKADLWSNIRSFFRHQFSRDARHALRREQTKLQRKSRIVTEAEFAQIPILNPSQLVARWRQQVPATYISDANDLPVPKLDAGLYLLEATDGRFKAYTLVIVTDMALVTRTTAGGITAFVVDRVTGAPVSGVKVDGGYGQNASGSATTDANGIADLPIAGKKGDNDSLWVVAAKGRSVAITTPGGWMLNFNAARNIVGYAFTERPVYRPTHTVHWKAILREKSGNALAIPKAGKAHVVIQDGADQTVFEKDMPLVNGNVSGDYELAKDAALGYYTLRVSEGESVVTASFHVEEYRKPEYRVQVTAAQKRVLEGATVPVTIDSRYFFGEPVSGGKVKYRIYHERHYWWGDGDDEDDASAEDAGTSDDTGSSYNGDEEAEKTGVLDANGTLTVQVPTHAEGGSHPDLDYTVEAGVTDAANREITGRGRFLATYSTFRVNVEPVSYAVRANEVAKVRITAVDYDEKPVSTHVHVQLRFNHWEDGRNNFIDGASTDVTTDATGHATAELPVGTPKYSSAEVVATASSVQSGTPDPGDSSYLYVLGLGEQSWDSSTSTAQIVTDKKSYAPGDVAHISIVSEADNFHALVIVEGASLLKREVMNSSGKTLSFDLPITADSQPNITVSALFLRNNTLYQATNRIQVPPTQQKLQVEVTPTQSVFQPQQSATYDVTAKDYAGRPVSADFSMGVVDEAIYSLYPDTSGDMIKALYPQRYSSAEVESSLEYYFSGEAGDKSPMLAERRRYHPQLAQVKPGNEAAPKVRKAFPDTAYWAPDIHTDASGHARVTLTFPDSLTTWRATVHAVTDDSKAGSASNKVLVRKNVLVRMGTPRFMIKGDEITLPVIVHNYLDSTKTAKVSLNVSGLDVVHAPDASVTVPSKGEATVLWRLRATQVGTAKLTAAALTDAESDALEISFPVEPAGVAKSLASSGVITQAASDTNANVSFPANTDPAAHSMRIEVSPSIAGSLFSALDYLTSYPYGCTEQTMSSFLPDVIVSETLARLKPGTTVDEADLRAKMQAGLDRLQDYQHDDGGWGWWKEDDSRVYMTAYVVGGLGQGSQYVKLTPAQTQMVSRGRLYLHTQLKQHPKMRPELRAAVVYALSWFNDGNLKDALDSQWDSRRSLQPEALAMTGLAMLQQKDARASGIADLLRSAAVRKGELVSWTGSYVPLLDVDYNNDAEATAYAVRLLAKMNPNDPLLPGAAQWLMLARNSGGWWESTEQTAMVLFGLVDYLAASHELDANFSVDVRVNGKSVGQRGFTSADAMSGASLKIDLPAAQLAAGGNNVQIVRQGGQGRVYWSVRGRYYSTEKKDYQAGSLSLNLTRDYYKLQPVQKDGKVVYSLQPLSGEAQVGDVLAVHEAINGSPMRYLLLEDPIPAGVEFVTNEGSYPIDKRPGGWFDWFTRREFHDDHAAFFASDFNGRQEVFYLVRVVNAGSFNISPAHVEAMYQPEVQASSDALHLNVPAPGGVQ